MPPIDLSQIEKLYKASFPDGYRRKYFHFHRYRYLNLLKTIDRAIDTDSQGTHILDIGPDFQTLLLRQFFPAVRVHTLGFKNERIVARGFENHYHLDFNDLDKELDLDIPPMDMVICCEVIEHLSIRPDLVFEQFYKILAPGGYLFIQTPNAVAIHKRLNMLLGKNPYQVLKPHRMGHIRENTIAELKNYLTKADFELVSFKLANYFTPPDRMAQEIFRIIEPLVPPSFRDGMAALARRKT